MSIGQIFAGILTAIVFAGGLLFVGVSSLIGGKDLKFGFKCFMAGVVFLFASILMAATTGYITGWDDSTDRYNSIIRESTEKNRPAPPKRPPSRIQKASKAPTWSGLLLSPQESLIKHRRSMSY